MTVALAYIHEENVTHSFFASLQALTLYDLHHGQHFFGGGDNPLAMRCGTNGLVVARNKVAQRVLDGDYDWLLWIDSDMGFAPDTLDRLLDVADPADRPIVGALCFAQQEHDVDGYNGFATGAAVTIFDWSERDGGPGFVSRPWYPPNRLVRCDGTGSACLLVHRTVLEKIHREYGPVWYQQSVTSDGKGLIAEDLSFCMRAATVGCPVHIHTGVKTTHMKTEWVSDRQFWAQAYAFPALDPVDVLVPVMRRPHNARPFMEALRASSGLARAYAIADPDDVDTQTAWKEAGADVLISERGNRFSQKVNYGYTVTDADQEAAPWIFLAGDDVRFRAGWLDHAEQAAEISGADVVGTNDLANPRVTSGEHATHQLIRRRYVADVGASWDGPGIVCHEGYRHWFVDDEIVNAAKQRDTFAMALGSRVAHLHPAWGTADNDDVYRIGEHYADRDKRLFIERLRANA